MISTSAKNAFNNSSAPVSLDIQAHFEKGVVIYARDDNQIEIKVGDREALNDALQDLNLSDREKYILKGLVLPDEKRTPEEFNNSTALVYLDTEMYKNHSRIILKRDGYEVEIETGDLKALQELNISDLQKEKLHAFVMGTEGVKKTTSSIGPKGPTG